MLTVSIVTHVDENRAVDISPAFVRLSVYLHDVSKAAATRITEHGTKVVHHESWKLIYFGVKITRHKMSKSALILSAGF